MAQRRNLPAPRAAVGSTVAVQPAEPETAALPDPSNRPLDRKQRMAGAQSKCWLDYRSPGYERYAERWAYARDHYTGELILPTKMQRYLLKRLVGEPEESYWERARIADYTPHFAAVVDSLAGMLSANEGDKKEVWGPEGKPGLGSPDDETTPIGRLWRDADGTGTGWPTFWRLMATEFTAIHTVWLTVDAANGEPFVRAIPAEAVVNVLYGPNGNLTEVLVLEESDTRASLEDEPVSDVRYLRYTVSGWQRYRKTKDNKAEALTGEGNSGSYAYVDRRGNPALPIYCVTLPLRRMVGYLLARKANAIFNLESSRDFLLRVANFPRLNVIGKDNLYRKVAAALMRGENLLQNDPTEGTGHHYIAPDSGSATVAGQTLQQKIESFYITAFREYGDSARERTATEVKQDVSAGVGAFLQLLKAAVDDAENNALWRIEQTLWPEDSSRWFHAKVERSDDFAPVDVNMTIERLTKRYYGPEGRAPLGRSAQIAVAKKVAEWDGLPVDEDEIAAAIDTENTLRVQQALSSFTLPPRVKAAMAAKLIEATGLIAPAKDATPEQAEAEREKLRTELLAEMEESEQEKVDEGRQEMEFRRAAMQSRMEKGGAPPAKKAE